MIDSISEVRDSLRTEIRGYPAWLVGTIIGVVLIGVVLMPVPLSESSGDGQEQRLGELNDSQMNVSATERWDVRETPSSGLLIEADYFDSDRMPSIHWGSESHSESYEYVLSYDAEKSILYSKESLTDFDSGETIVEESWKTNSLEVYRLKYQVNASSDVTVNDPFEGRTKASGNTIVDYSVSSNEAVIVYTRQPGMFSPQEFWQASVGEQRASLRGSSYQDGELVGRNLKSGSVSVSNPPGIAFELESSAGFVQPEAVSGARQVYGDSYVPLVSYVFGAEREQTKSYERTRGAIHSEEPEWVQDAKASVNETE